MKTIRLSHLNLVETAVVYIRLLLLIASLSWQCNGECGYPASPNKASLNYLNDRGNEGAKVIYSCPDDHRLVDMKNEIRTCKKGIWSGEAPRCVEPMPEIKLKSIETPSSSKQLVNLEEQTCFSTISGIKKYAVSFEDTNPNTTSVVGYVEFRTNVSTGNLLDVFINDYRHCRLDRKAMSEEGNETIYTLGFLCELNSVDDKNAELAAPPNGFEISLIKFMFANICDIQLYQFPPGCGFPDIPYKSFGLKNEAGTKIDFTCSAHLGVHAAAKTLHCGTDGKWLDKFMGCYPVDTCPLLNVSDSKLQIEYKNVNYINGSEFPVTESIAIYSCSNSLTLNETLNITFVGPEMELIGTKVRYCLSDGTWDGVEPYCELPSKSLSIMTIVIIVLVVVLLAVGGAALGFITYQRKKMVSELRKQEMRKGEGIYDSIELGPNGDIYCNPYGDGMIAGQQGNYYSQFNKPGRLDAPYGSYVTMGANGEYVLGRPGDNYAGYAMMGGGGMYVQGGVYAPMRGDVYAPMSGTMMNATYADMNTIGMYAAMSAAQQQPDGSTTINPTAVTHIPLYTPEYGVVMTTQQLEKQYDQESVYDDIEGFAATDNVAVRNETENRGDNNNVVRIQTDTSYHMIPANEILL